MDSLTPQDEEQQAERENRAELAALTEAADVRWLMESEQGRRIVCRLLDSSGVFSESSFRADALMTAFLEGQRYEGNRLMVQTLNECPELYVQMLKERKNRDDRDQRSDAYD